MPTCIIIRNDWRLTWIRDYTVHDAWSDIRLGMNWKLQMNEPIWDLSDPHILGPNDDWTDWKLLERWMSLSESWVIESNSRTEWIAQCCVPMNGRGRLNAPECSWWYNNMKIIQIWMKIISNKKMSNKKQFRIKNNIESTIKYFGWIIKR